MKVYIFSDTHGITSFKEGEPDVVFLLGDIDYYEIKKIDKLYDCPKFGVLGNHDAPDFFINTSIVNLHGKIIEWNGYILAGFGGSPIYKRKYFGQYSEEECFEFMKNVPKVDFFLAHSNPAWTLNFDENDAHRGFTPFADYINIMQPKNFFYGHLHENKQYKVGNTNIYSVYPFKEINL